MIHRHYRTGQKLDVAGLNEITVLIDRSEAQMTEVALNTWRGELLGPPHFHAEKEQVFYVTSGRGRVQVRDATYPVKPDDLVYVPANAVHQTVVPAGETLEYLLLNIFLSAEREGHTSFADHIEKVRDIRRQQAERQRPDPGGAAGTPRHRSRHIVAVRKTAPGKNGNAPEIVLLNRDETARCAVSLYRCSPNALITPAMPHSTEQTLFILSGGGSVKIGEESAAVQPGEVLLVPRDHPLLIQTGAEGMDALCLCTFLSNR